MLWRLKCYEKSISNVIIITSIFTYIFTVRGEYIMIDLNSELMEQKMKVDFNTYELSVKELLSMVNDGLINIAPEYQRQFRWDEERQSSLVESLFLGIPVPSLFMATNVDGTWEVIDGVQRLSTMICFAGDDSVREKVNAKKVEPLKLKGLSKLANFNDKRFSDLPVGVQNKFKLTSIKVTTLSTPQEIRSCVYRGGFNDFLKELSKDSNFKNCVHLSERQENDGTREELVLRFFAYLYDLDSFEHSVKDFLNNYMSKADKGFNYSENDKLFRTVFKILNDALPNGISKGRKNTPLNLFEAVSVGAALAYMNNGKINTAGMAEWLKDKEYDSGR